MDAYIAIVKMYNNFLHFVLIKVVDKKFSWKSFQYLILATGNSINFEVKKAANLRDIFFMMEFFYYFFFGLLTAFQYANLTPHKTGSYYGKFYAKCCGQTFFRRICYDLVLFLFPYHAYFLTRSFAQP